MGRVVQQWYALPRSGQPFFGPVPEGSVVLDGPHLVAPIEVAVEQHEAEPEPLPVNIAPELPSAPAGNAKRAEWADHCVELGADRGEVDGLGRPALVKLAAVLRDQAVESSESGGTVDTEVPGEHLAPDAEESGAVPDHGTEQ